MILREFFVKKILTALTFSIFLPITISGCSNDRKASAECDSTKFDCTPKDQISSSEAKEMKSVPKDIIEDGNVIQTAAVAESYKKPKGIELSKCGGNDFCDENGPFTINFLYSNAGDSDNVKSLELSLPMGSQPFKIDSVEVKTKKKGFCEISNVTTDGYYIDEEIVSIEVENCPFNQINDVVFVSSGNTYIL